MIRNSYIKEKAEIISQTLESVGLVDISVDYSEKNEGLSVDEIGTLAVDAGSIQTLSVVAYNNITSEFYYYVEYLGIINDLWGDYDLVSLQSKDDAVDVSLAPPNYGYGDGDQLNQFTEDPNKENQKFYLE